MRGVSSNLFTDRTDSLLNIEMFLKFTNTLRFPPRRSFSQR